MERMDDEIAVSGLKYTLNHKTKTAMLTGATKNTINSVKIPDTVKGHGKTYKVTGVAEKAFKGFKKLASLDIGKNLETIGKSAFEACGKLKKIILRSANITKIEKSAFKGIYKLPDLYLAKGLKSAYVKKIVKLLLAGGIQKLTQIFK